MKVAIVSRLAQAERVEQALWYEQQLPGLGDQFDDAVAEAIRYIQQHPGIGAPYSERYRRFLLSRPFQRFSLIYQEVGDVLIVAAIWAGERNPHDLDQRLV